MRMKHRKTRKAWNDPGHAHFLTYSCFRRWPLLSRDRSRMWVIDALEHARRQQNLLLWAYVIMPEHVHVLLFPNEPAYEIRHVLVALKRPVSNAARDYLRNTGEQAWLKRLTVRYPSREVFRFWQPGGGYDRNILHEKSVAEVIDYIHGNPVRRELVSKPTDWSWSSARYWEGWGDVPIRMDKPFE